MLTAAACDNPKQKDHATQLQLILLCDQEEVNEHGQSQLDMLNEKLKEYELN